MCREGLARSHHTVTVIGNNAYIFGGKTADGKTCTTDIHKIPISSDQEEDVEYACISAASRNPIGTGSVPLPGPRYGHASCTRNNLIVVHGGRNDEGLVDEDSCIWLWDSKTQQWSTARSVNMDEAKPATRHGHQIFLDEKRDILVLHGGQTSQEDHPSETWLFDFKNASWRKLPPSPATSSGAVLVGTNLYSLSGTTDMSGSVHSLKLDDSSLNSEDLAWATVEFPSGPLTPGPQPREGSSLVPINTGYGRYYLIRLLGSRSDEKKSSGGESPTRTDMWAMQLPSEGISASKVKDMIRDKLPKAESGSYNWAEVELVEEGKEESQPTPKLGPRSYFGAHTGSDGRTVVLSGGVDELGHLEANAWVLKIK